MAGLVFSLKDKAKGKNDGMEEELSSGMKFIRGRGASGP